MYSQRGFWPAVGRLAILVLPHEWCPVYRREFRAVFSFWHRPPLWLFKPLAWLYNYWGCIGWKLERE